jgi:bifunctional UDP-N-acetylglucosamine pyrophosphorylase/glucosamine-1-phosphate N-acetyltransferase
MSDLHVVILAAGKGRRMHSRVAKVLHRIGGLTLIDRVIRTARKLGASSMTVVVGHLADQVKAALACQTDLRIVEQREQLGTAHAVLETAPLFEPLTGTLLLLSGDVPLLSVETLDQLLTTHRTSGAAATVVTAIADRPYGYGRIVRSGGQIARIVEERDASPAERKLHEVNAGLYAFDLGPLFSALKKIAAENAQREYYLTDLVGVYRRRKLTVGTVVLPGIAAVRGVNSRTELAEVGALVRQGKNEELMGRGVTIIDPATTYVDDDVAVGADTVIHPGVILEGRTRIGAACEIHAGVRIVDSAVGDRVIINNYCVITGSTIADGARVGPFAHVRPNSEIGADARVGNFVELKKTVLGAGSKANHLTYLGDATIGANVNVGAGTITCNYDGVHKHPTVIEDGAFIGSDSQLVAPVTVGAGAYVAAGSSITEDVPPGALGIARAKQVNKPGWTGKKNKGRKEPK